MESVKKTEMPLHLAVATAKRVHGFATTEDRTGPLNLTRALVKVHK